MFFDNIIVNPVQFSAIFIYLFIGGTGVQLAMQQLAHGITNFNQVFDASNL